MNDITPNTYVVQPNAIAGWDDELSLNAVATWPTDNNQ